jgi:hypothetical protein
MHDNGSRLPGGASKVQLNIGRGKKKTLINRTHGFFVFFPYSLRCSRFFILFWGRWTIASSMTIIEGKKHTSTRNGLEWPVLQDALWYFWTKTKILIFNTHK